MGAFYFGGGWMMDLTLEGLEKCFNEAVDGGAEYVAVVIEVTGFLSDY